MKKLRGLLCFLLALCLLPVQAGASGESVKVTLPGFDVSLGGMTISNEYSKYPLLVYRDITYFPMTYYDCRLLGLKTGWSQTEGLSIHRNDVNPSVYRREVQDTRNAKSYTAQIASGKITVNGKVIDNSREEYPLLLFRDVTYFPLTWRFAVEEFDWGYHFDAEGGLSVSNGMFSTEETLVCLDDHTTYNGDWGAWVSQWGTMGGNSRWVDAGIELPISFSSSQNGQGEVVSTITFWNYTGEDIQIHPSELWEYRVYRQIAGRDELVYRQAVPFYAGEFSQKGIASWEIYNEFWDTCEKRTYRVELVHPDHLLYESGVGAVHTEPIREFKDPMDLDGNFWLTHTHTVEVKGFQPAGEKYQINRAKVASADYAIAEGVMAPDLGRGELTEEELDRLVDTYNRACMTSARYDMDPGDTVRSFSNWVRVYTTDGTDLSLCCRGRGEVRVWGGLEDSYLDDNFFLHSQELYDLLQEVRH